MSEPLHPIEASALHARRERVFLVLAGLFLGTLAMLNVLGVTRFIKLLELEREGTPRFSRRRSRAAAPPGVLHPRHGESTV